jgi:hypothetical protein
LELHRHLCEECSVRLRAFEGSFKGPQTPFKPTPPPPIFATQETHPCPRPKEEEYIALLDALGPRDCLRRSYGQS